jgi:histidine triad (HIT) family protein
MVSGDIVTELEYESDNLIAFSDINPVAPIHILIIPKIHIASMNDVTENQSGIIAEMFLAAVKIAKKKQIDADGYKLLIRTGKNGGQEVPHIHLHLIGGGKMYEDIHII